MKILIAFCFFSIINSLSADDEKIDIERLHFEEDVNIIKAVKINNLYGNIRLSEHKQNHIVFHAVSQYSEQHRAMLKKNIQNGILSLSIHYENIPNTNAQERVDVAVTVPKHVDLEIQIEKGHLSSKGINNKINVKSINSDLKVKTSSSANLLTQNGKIDFTLIPHKVSKKIKLQTYKGNIRLNFHNKQIPKVSIISGGITTSNSSTLLMNKKKHKRTITYKPSSTFDNISIQTDTGDIQLVEIEQL